MFDRECRRLDYLLQEKGDDIDETLEKVLDEIFFIEDKIFNFQEALAQCTEGYLVQLGEIDDDDEEGRIKLMNTYTHHLEKVENQIKKLVCLFLLLFFLFENKPLLRLEFILNSVKMFTKHFLMKLYTQRLLHQFIL